MSKSSYLIAASPAVVIVTLLVGIFTPSNIVNARDKDELLTMAVQALVTMPQAPACNGADSDFKVLFSISLQDAQEDEELRFLAKGYRSRNQKIKVGDLMAGEVNLDPITLYGRNSRSGVSDPRWGLWVQRLSTGERIQLSNQPGTPKCNTKGLAGVKYSNLWATLNSAQPVD